MLRFLRVPSEIRSECEALSHFPELLEHEPDVIRSPSLNSTYSHTHSNANTPKGSGLMTHSSVWREAKARTDGGLIAVVGCL